MTRVAYLIEVSASGKSCIACRLKDHVQVIEADRVRDRVERQLHTRYPQLPDEWQRCDNLLRDEKSLSGFGTVLTELRPSPSHERPLLAEGISLGHDRFRHAFREALVCLGTTISDERVFWIDPPAEVIWRYRQIRGRKNQVDETVETVREHCDYYAERLNHGLISRHEDGIEATEAIKRFFLA